MDDFFAAQLVGGACIIGAVVFLVAYRGSRAFERRAGKTAAIDGKKPHALGS